MFGARRCRQPFGRSPEAEDSGIPWTDRDIALALRDRYAAAVGKAFESVSWPDENKTGNRNAPSVDALLESADGERLAIEVTKIETYPDQRSDDSRFLALVNAVQPVVGPLFPKGVEFFIPCSGFPCGVDWQAIDHAIRDFLVNLARTGNLSPGVSRHEVNGVPFPILVTYAPELNLPASFARVAPGQTTRRDALFESVKAALDHKRTELDAYRSSGTSSILVLEHHDIALISSARVYMAFFRAKREIGCDHLTAAFFCRTDNPHRLDQWYCFLGPDAVLAHFNRPNFLFGPQHDGYWEMALRSEEKHYGPTTEQGSSSPSRTER